MTSASSSSSSLLQKCPTSTAQLSDNEIMMDEPLTGRRRATQVAKSTSRDTTDRVISASSSPERETKYRVHFRDGVPTTDWLIGELPRYPSWSIYSLGKYFSYSHSYGLPSRGFFRSSNFLLPWDVTIKQGSTASAGARGGRPGKVGRGGKFRGGRADSDMVKLFIGFEFECPLGHRFFLAGPDRAMDGPMQSGQVKRAVHGLLTQDLPLFMPCRCQGSSVSSNSQSISTRGSRTDATCWSGAANRPSVVWAQLTRIYLAIPAAPIRVKIQPRIRPGPIRLTPIFHLGHVPKQDDDLERVETEYEAGFSASDDFDENRDRHQTSRLNLTSSGPERQRPGYVLLDNGLFWVVRIPYPLNWY